eukprot:3940610-Rhodomonas_salina.2
MSAICIFGGVISVAILQDSMLRKVRRCFSRTAAATRTVTRREASPPSRRDVWTGLRFGGHSI